MSVVSLRQEITLENLCSRLSGSCMDSAEEGSFRLGILSVSDQCCNRINFQTAFATLVCFAFVVTDAQQAFILRYLLFCKDHACVKGSFQQSLMSYVT